MLRNLRIQRKILEFAILVAFFYLVFLVLKKKGHLESLVKSKPINKFFRPTSNPPITVPKPEDDDDFPSRQKRQIEPPPTSTNQLSLVANSPIFELSLDQISTLELIISQNGQNTNSPEILLKFIGEVPDGFNIDQDENIIIFEPAESRDNLFDTDKKINSYIEKLQNFAIIAENQQTGAKSIPLYPNFTFCACSPTSLCIFEENINIRKNVYALPCQCPVALTGAYCLQDKDGCLDLEMNCYPGVECIDNPAPKTGYSCGPCPLGYVGDGKTCEKICPLPESISNGKIFIPENEPYEIYYENNTSTSYLMTDEYFKIKCDPGFRLGVKDDPQTGSSPASNNLNPNNLKITCQNDGTFTNYASLIECQDINECTDPSFNKNDECNDNSICINTLGSYSCVCKENFVKDDDLENAICLPELEFTELQCTTLGSNSVALKWHVNQGDSQNGVAQSKIVILEEDLSENLNVEAFIEQQFLDFTLSDENETFRDQIMSAFNLTSSNDKSLQIFRQEKGPFRRIAADLSSKTNYLMMVVIFSQDSSININQNINYCRITTLPGQAAIPENLAVKNDEIGPFDAKLDFNIENIEDVYAFAVLTVANDVDLCLANGNMLNMTEISAHSRCFDQTQIVYGPASLDYYLEDEMNNFNFRILNLMPFTEYTYRLAPVTLGSYSQFGSTSTPFTTEFYENDSGRAFPDVNLIKRRILNNFDFFADLQVSAVYQGSRIKSKFPEVEDVLSRDHHLFKSTIESSIKKLLLYRGTALPIIINDFKLVTAVERPETTSANNILPFADAFYSGRSVRDPTNENLKFVWHIKIAYDDLLKLDHIGLDDQSVIISELLATELQNIFNLEGQTEFSVDILSACDWPNYSDCQKIDNKKCTNIISEPFYYCECENGFVLDEVTNSCVRNSEGGGSGGSDALGSSESSQSLINTFIEEQEILSSMNPDEIMLTGSKTAYISPVSCRNIDYQTDGVLLLIENMNDELMIEKMQMMIAEILSKFDFRMRVLIFGFDRKLSRMYSSSINIGSLQNSFKNLASELDRIRVRGLKRLDFSLADSLLDLERQNEIATSNLKFHTFILSSGIYGQSLFSSGDVFNLQISIVSNLSRKTYLLMLGRKGEVEFDENMVDFVEKFEQLQVQSRELKELQDDSSEEIDRKDDIFVSYELPANNLPTEAIDIILSHNCLALPCKTLRSTQSDENNDQLILDTRPSDIIFLVDVSKKVRNYYSVILEGILKYCARMTIDVKMTKIALMVYSRTSEIYLDFNQISNYQTLFENFQEISTKSNDLASRPLLGEAFVKIRKFLLNEESGYRGETEGISVGLKIIAFVGGSTFTPDRAIEEGFGLKNNYNADIIILSTFQSDDPNAYSDLEKIASENFIEKLDLTQNSYLYEQSDLVYNALNGLKLQNIIPNICEEGDGNLILGPNWVNFDQSADDSDNNDGTTVTWQKMYDVSGYQIDIFQASTNAKVFSRITDSNDEDNTLFLSDLPSGRQFITKISGVRPDLSEMTIGNLVEKSGNFSNQFFFTTLPQPPDKASANSMPLEIDDDPKLTKIRVKIESADSNIESYRVNIVNKQGDIYLIDYLDVNENAGKSQVDEVLYAPLIPRQKYIAQIQSLIGDKISSVKKAEFKVSPLNIPKIEPADLVLLEAAESSLNFTWPMIKMAKNYLINFRDGQTLETLVREYLPKDQNFYSVDKGLVPGANYLVQIFVIDHNNVKSEGVTATFSTRPSAPETLNLLDIGSDFITIELSADPFSQYFEVELITAENQSIHKKLVQNIHYNTDSNLPDQTNIQIIKIVEKLNPGSEYSITVKSISNNQESEPKFLKLKTLAAPVDINDIEVLEVEDTSFSIIFDGVEGAQIYYVCQELVSVRLESEIEADNDLECTQDLIEVEQSSWWG